MFIFDLVITKKPDITIRQTVKHFTNNNVIKILEMCFKSHIETLYIVIYLIIVQS